MAAKAAGWKTTIVRSDTDLMQLVEHGSVDMLDTMNDRRIGRDYVIEQLGVPPEQLCEVLGRMGDSVDNLPAVPVGGPQPAWPLIHKSGSGEHAITNPLEHPKP